MRILIDARTVGRRFSGVGNYVQELVQAIGRTNDDIRVDLAVHGDSTLRDVSFDERFTPLDVPWSHESHPWGDLWEHWRLPALARDRGVDVLHGPAFLIPTRRTAVTKVVTVHDLVAYSHRETVPWRYALYMRWLIARAVRYAERVITDAESIRREILSRFEIDDAKVESIPLGVSSTFTPPGPEALARVRRRYGLGRPYLLFVGNLEPRKNLPGLLDAFRLVRERSDRDVELVIAGAKAWKSGPLSEALRDPVLTDHVRVTGYVEAEDLPALYGGAEIFVFPTFWEGFGLPVLEAMATGTAVVASGVASIPEAAGGAAILVDPHSRESIARGIVSVLQNDELRRDLEQRGRAHARTRTWDETARRTLRAYRAARGDSQ